MHAKIYFFTSLLGLLLCVSLSPISYQASAEDSIEQDSKTISTGRPSTMGVINLEQEEKKKAPYLVEQEEAITYFKDLESKLPQLAQGNSPSLGFPSEGSLNYLSGVFLYCVNTQGTCPWILDSIVEADVINSKQNNKATCPSMKRFWTRWVKNGLEERQKYMVRTAFISVTGRFTTIERPKYLKCESLVQERMGTSPSGFKERYAENSETCTAVKKLNAYLQELKSKIPNVFVEIGAANSSGGSQEPRDAPLPSTKTTVKRTTSGPSTGKK